MGFKINPYHECVANKMIDGKQCNVLWYVDNLKISHAGSAVVDRIIREIKKHFGKMMVMRGKNHEYIGMSISFIGNGKVKISMQSYIEEALNAFKWVGGIIGKLMTTPETKELFTVKEHTDPLDNICKEAFHHIVAKMLYVSQRARVDIRTAIAFLCT